MPVSGRHIDDAAVTLGQHHAQFMLHAQECAENVGIKGGRVALGGLLCHGTELAFGSGGVYSHIQATEARDSLIDEAVQIIFMADVSAPILCLSAELAEFSD